MGKIVQQKDRKGGKVYPVTLAGAVVTPDGRTFQNALDEVASQQEESTGKLTELERKLNNLVVIDNAMV